MSEICNEITAKARRLGACGRLREGMDLTGLASLLHTPQGREWATVHDFPKVSDLLDFDRADLVLHRIFPDFAGEADNKGSDWVFTGPDTEATVKASGTDALHHITALDGASVRVEASGHAVVSVEVSATARVDIVNTDKTAIISCHRSVN